MFEASKLSPASESIARDVLGTVLYDATNDAEVETWFKDLLSHGCSSGMISHLIYYKDTHAFFDKHYDEIEDLRNDFEESIGAPLEIKHDLKNFLAWFAFEQIAHQLAEKLGLDL